MTKYFARRFERDPAAYHAAISAMSWHLDTVARYALLVSLLWGFWGVLQISNSSITYDYERYSMARFTAYREGLSHLPLLLLSKSTS